MGFIKTWQLSHKDGNFHYLSDQSSHLEQILKTAAGIRQSFTHFFTLFFGLRSVTELSFSFSESLSMNFGNEQLYFQRNKFQKNFTYKSSVTPQKNLWTKISSFTYKVKNIKASIKTYWNCFSFFQEMNFFLVRELWKVIRILQISET